MAEVSAETVEWLVDTVGAQIVLITAYKHIGHSVHGCMHRCPGGGRILSMTCWRPMREREIPLAVGNRDRAC